MDNQTDVVAKTRSAGQVVFVIASLVIVVFLLSQLTSQTIWSDKARNFAGQPRFWPAVALIVMVAGFGFHLLRMRRRRPNQLDWIEVRRWAEPLEFFVWFMGYVFAVPILGFLPMSIAFACALTWRLGYRKREPLLLAACFAFAMVMLFKGFLSVNIPGGAIYEFLPGSLRSFALTYL